MKFTVQTILSLPVDKASSHLLIINAKIRILLDCGISQNFDFSKYCKRAAELKTVSLVLISHSSLEYSGALAFLIDEVGLNPNIFYTTQSIMRCSPLNLHEELLILRSSKYRKDVFNRIYKIYQSINVVKTEQKKSIDVGEKTGIDQTTVMEAEEQSAIGEVDKIIYFTCYAAGGVMGSLAWRISFGIVNVLYMVEYNNYSLYHMHGLDFNQLKQATNVMITDVCQDIDDSKMKKQKLYEKIKEIVLGFYQENNLMISKPRPITSQDYEPKLLITCYPNELLIELMAVIKKIIEEMQPSDNRQKIKVIHLSSRFLQLVKSQIDTFSHEFKELLENMEQYFIHAKALNSRINLATVNSLEGILNDEISGNVKIFHIGRDIEPEAMNAARKEGKDNINNLTIMQTDERVLSSARKIEEIEQEQIEQELLQEESSKKQVSSEMMESQAGVEVENSSDLIKDDNQFDNPKFVRGNYFRKNAFPYFIKSCREESHGFDEYGMRHEYARFEERKNIEQYNKEESAPDLNLQKKNSTIEVMNIDFKICDEEKYRPINYKSISILGLSPQKTNFNSSMQLILELKPAYIVIINCEQNERIFKKYQRSLLNSELRASQIKNLAAKGYYHFLIENQLIAYKSNYIPIDSDSRMQKVKGKISKKNGVVVMHLECLEEKQHLDFRIDKFFKQLKNQHYNCLFTKLGLIVQGIRIYRDKKQIILEGTYSEEYFKVRKLLYNFLQMQ